MILPAWITVDADNSRLVGAVGTYPGLTKAAANAAAQAALDAFANEALTAGNLACVQPCALPEDLIWEVTSVSGSNGGTSVNSVDGSNVLHFAIYSSAGAAGAAPPSSVLFSTNVNNTTDSDCDYNVEVDCTITGDSYQFDFSSTTSWGETFSFGSNQTLNPRHVIRDRTLTVPANTNLLVTLLFEALGCIGPDGNCQATGTVTFTPL